MTQPKALRLADDLEHPAGSSGVYRDKAAAELRRLHEVNQMLLEALKEIEILPGISSANLYARKTLAKLKEKNA